MGQPDELVAIVTLYRTLGDVATEG